MRLLICVIFCSVVGCAPVASRATADGLGSVASARMVHSPADLSPYAALRSAYVARNAELASSAYGIGARLVYEGGPAGTVSYVGLDAIRASFQELFDGVDPADALDLNFRITERRVHGARIEEKGLYRLRAGRSFAGYGRFDVVRDLSSGLFLSDLTRPASRSEFEEADGPVLLAPDEDDLDPAYYGALSGRYRQPNGCDLVVTSSVVRLFVRDDCSQSWRGLTRVSGRVWTAGDRVLSDVALATFRFAAPDSAGSVPSVAVALGDDTVEAIRIARYRTESVAFVAPDGVRLAGTLYLPLRPGKHPAVALVHGSGPQDRDGYASIIAVLADALATSGVAVLAFDKRGVRESEGSGGSFAVLGRDADAAIDALRQRPDIDPARVGLAGSSQAGWVIAKAIELGANPAAVFLIGAAGTALDVPEQNLYNTQVRMECDGMAPADVRLALEQQRAFFAYVLDPGPPTASHLDRLTEQARQRSALSDWLFPSSADTDLGAPSWFTTLELDFDPLPVWKAYDGAVSFVFAEHDDATPTDVAVTRVRADIPGASVIVLDDAQHLGLRATGVCTGELRHSEEFHPGLLKALEAFALELRSQ